MDHAAISEQIAGIIDYVADNKRLTHAGASIPFAPAEVVDSAEFSSGGGGLIEDYDWAATCHTTDFTTAPQIGDTIQYDATLYAIQRIGRVRETGEVILYLANPDA